MRNEDKAWFLVTEYTNHVQAEITRACLTNYNVEAWIRADDCGGQAGGQSFIQRVKVNSRESNRNKVEEVILQKRNVSNED